MKTQRRALKPDAQPFDEIRIVTMPRYKTSGLSGDEWRISAQVQFYRKGKLVHQDGASTVQYAAQMLPAMLLRAIDDGKAYFAGENDTCDQEGCADIATVVYRVKKEFSRDRPHEWNREIDDEIVIRQFCAKHSTRGDCGLDDADGNYEKIVGESEAPRTEDVSPSVFGGVFSMEPTGDSN